MKQPPGKARVWRPQYVQNIELVCGRSKAYATPDHFHEELEIGINLGRSWDFYYRGAKHTIPVNTFALTQPGEVHRAYSASNEISVFRGLRIDAVLLQSVATQITGRETGLPYFPTVMVHEHTLNQRLLDFHIALEENTSQLEQQSLVLDLLAQLVLQCAADFPPLEPTGEEIEPVKQVRDYITQYYAEDISLEQLTQVANLSPFYLNRAFRKLFGLAPHAYQTQVRIVRAKALLRQGWKIAQVAAETGFATPSHFGMYFKRLVGTTPGQYLKQSKNLTD